MDQVCLELDLHCLDLRFAVARLEDRHAVERRASSIEQCGQIVPRIAVVNGNGRSLVLIDGYRRVAALRRLGRDTTQPERWECDLASALVAVLARAEGRRFAPSKRRCCSATWSRGWGCRSMSWRGGAGAMSAG
jgi:ParB family transcriptional regulator, chromosome partitioning protein